MGILAHVDAGKTTLSEGMLYLSGTVRKLGRVDRRMHFLTLIFRARQRNHHLFEAGSFFIGK